MIERCDCAEWKTVMNTFWPCDVLPVDEDGKQVCPFRIDTLRYCPWCGKHLER